MTRILALQHIHCETLGIIADILEDEGFSPQYVRPFEGQPVPQEMGGSAGLIVMGGPMGVYDHPEYPFLRDEMSLIEQALHQEKPVLGICLGSQLLATTLGAPVRKGKKKEIGWYPVTLLEAANTDQLWTGVSSPYTAYHWHGDIFNLPHGATSLASSQLTQYQAFRYGENAYGFLFHMEITDQIIQNMVEIFANELKAEGIDGHELLSQAHEYLPKLQNLGNTVFQRWVDLLDKEIS